MHGRFLLCSEEIACRNAYTTRERLGQQACTPHELELAQLYEVALIKRILAKQKLEKNKLAKEKRALKPRQKRFSTNLISPDDKLRLAQEIADNTLTLTDQNTRKHANRSAHRQCRGQKFALSIAQMYTMKAKTAIIDTGKACGSKKMKVHDIFICDGRDWFDNDVLEALMRDDNR